MSNRRKLRPQRRVAEPALPASAAFGDALLAARIAGRPVRLREAAAGAASGGLLEHLPGRHNQKTHGHRFNVPGDPTSGLRRTATGPVTSDNGGPSTPERPGVSVSPSRGRLHLTAPYDKQLIEGVKQLGGRWLPKSKTWSVPADKEDALEGLLSRVFDKPAEPADTLPDQVRISIRPNGKVEVRAPFNDGFRQEARKLAGSWDPDAKAWVFPPHREDQVRAAAAEQYGRKWQAAQRAAAEARQAAQQAQRQARQQATQRRGMTPRQRDLLKRLLNRHSRDAMFWHDFFDGAGGPDGQYAPGGPSSRQLAEWLDDLTLSQASSLIDDLIAWGKGY